MKESQEKVWDRIAPEWHEFKKPGEKTLNFLKKQSGKVLDLGSGSGRYLTKIKKGKMYLVDFSKEMIKLAKKRAKEKNIDAEFFVSDITKLPFQNDFFDAAIFIASLHCIPIKSKREKAVKELYRVLKPGARVKVTVWNKNSKWFQNKPKQKYIAWRDKGKRYYYLYDEKEVVDLFEKIGFQILKLKKPNKDIILIIKKP